MKIEWYQGSTEWERPKAFWKGSSKPLVTRWKPLALRRDEENREYKEFLVELEDKSTYRVTRYPDGTTLIMAVPRRSDSASGPWDI